MTLSVLGVKAWYTIIEIIKNQIKALTLSAVLTNLQYVVDIVESGVSHGG